MIATAVPASAGAVVTPQGKVPAPEHLGVSTLPTATVTLPAQVIHDAAYDARYFAAVPSDQRALSTVLERVASMTYRLNSTASPAAVNAELSTLRAQLVGAGTDLSRFGPTTQQQLAKAIPVLLSRASTAPLTGPARAAVASSLYGGYVARAASGFGDDQDRYSGGRSGEVPKAAGVRPAIGSSFLSVEQSMLDEANNCARASAGCAAVTDALLQPFTGVSVKATASSLAADPGAAAAFKALGVTVNANGTGTGNMAVSATAAVTLVAKIQDATAEAAREVRELDTLQVDLLVVSKDSAKQEESKAKAKSWIESQQATIKELQSKQDIAVKVLNALGGGTGDAAAVVKTVSTAMDVYSNVLTIVDTVSKAGSVANGLLNMTTAAATGNIVGAVMSLISIFAGGSPKPDPVFEATQKIQKQVADLRKDMDARFDKVDRSLGALMDTVNTGFATIDTQNKLITADVRATLQQLAAVQWSLNRLSQQLTTYATDAIRARIQGYIDAWIGYTARNGHAMSATEFAAAESALFTAATTDAAQSAVAGDLGLAADNESLGNLLSGYGQEKVRTVLDILARRFPGHAPLASAGLVNADDWARAAEAYRQLLDENPQYSLKLDGSRQATILARAKQLDTALVQLATPSGGQVPIVTDVVANAAQAMDAVSAALDAALAQWRADVAHSLDLWGGPEQPLTGASSGHLKDLTACGAATGLEDVGTQQRVLPRALLVLRAADSSVPMRACIGTRVSHSRETCRVLKNKVLCTSFARYARTLTVEWAPAGSWVTVDTLTRDYGEHIQCRDNFNDTTTCFPVSAYVPAWSAEVRDDVLANASHAQDVGQLDQARARTSGLLATWTSGLFTDLANRVRSGDLRVGFGHQDEGQDAARALSGAVMLLRSTLTMVAPSAVTGDEFVRSMLFGSQRLPSNDTTIGTSQGDLWVRLRSNVSSPPATQADAWIDWLNNGKEAANRLTEVVNAHLAASAAAGLADGSPLTDVTAARLRAGDAVLRQASWTVAGGPVNLGSVKVRSTKKATLTLNNSSFGRTLTIKRPTVIGPAAKDWTVVTTCASALAPSKSCSISVTVKPSAAGRRAATLRLALSPAGVGPTSVTLTATGTP